MNITHWLVLALGTLVAAYAIPGMAASVAVMIVLAVILAAANLSIKPSVNFFEIPANAATIGMFSLIINIFAVLLATEFASQYVAVSFWPIFWLAVALSGVNIFFESTRGFDWIKAWAEKRMAFGAKQKAVGASSISNEEVQHI